MLEYKWQVSSLTHCGNVRKVNEDSLFASSSPLLLAIADGMGGHEAGDVASQMVIQDLASATMTVDLDTATHQLNDTILASNSRIIDYSTSQLDGQTMGTTVVAMISQNHQGVGLWAGDSRLYQLSNNKLHQLTQDHSYVAELVRAGKLDPQDAINHPSSNIITRTVGINAELRLDQVRFEVAAGDTFLLCSDGLYNEVNESELLQAMQASDIHRASDWLLNLCLRRAARDNVSLIIARACEQLSDVEDNTLTFYPGQQ